MTAVLKRRCIPGPAKAEDPVAAFAGVGHQPVQRPYQAAAVTSGPNLCGWEPGRTAEEHLRKAAIEVKGGEGNSLNIPNRPEDVAEFVVWCHLDGSLNHRPGRGVQQIVGRIVADIVKSPKRIDALIIRDVLCGSKARPCPKYPTGAYPRSGPAASRSRNAPKGSARRRAPSASRGSERTPDRQTGHSSQPR